MEHKAKTISYRQKDFSEPLESESDKKYRFAKLSTKRFRRASRKESRSVKKYKFETQQKPSATAKKISGSPQKVKVIRNTHVEHTAKTISYWQKDFG